MPARLVVSFRVLFRCLSFPIIELICLCIVYFHIVTLLEFATLTTEAAALRFSSILLSSRLRKAQKLHLQGDFIKLSECWLSTEWYPSQRRYFRLWGSTPGDLVNHTFRGESPEGEASPMARG